MSFKNINLSKRTKIIIILVMVALISLQIGCRVLNGKLSESYRQNESAVILDRNDKTMAIMSNAKGYYSSYLSETPKIFEDLLLEKEDRFFYWHKGFNPVSIIVALSNKIGLSQRQGSSTLSQQLVKILLSKENERNANNKAMESLYTIALELSNSKKDILAEYINSAYFGNQVQGLESASHAYFGVTSSLLGKEQILQLLATLNNPTNNNPATLSNIEKTKILAENMELSIDQERLLTPAKAETNLKEYLSSTKPILELTGYIGDIKNGSKDKVTIDMEKNEQIRKIVARNVDLLKTQKAKNAAVVVISVPNNQIISMVGSPDSRSFTEGYQINMAEKPRQIGSTIKPFIYLKAFEKGMRPYTLIDDREYKFPSDPGFSIYPKNYDYQYRGEMTAHYALSNSINTVAVKTLEYVGIDEFKKTLIDDFGYKPFQNFDNYQLGIALGALEMNLIDLAHYSTVFPNGGNLKNLNIFSNQELNDRYYPNTSKQITDKSYIGLVNKILSDRKTSIDQFSAASMLNLPPGDDYALKTGTSHDFTDSWIVGYTPDFLVAVWVGNADNSATEGVSGQIGAGRIWNEVMQLLLNSEYNLRHHFDFSDIKEYYDQGTIQYGLEDDDYETIKNLIKAQDDSLILTPHDEDIFIFDERTKLSLKAKDDASWQIDGIDIGYGKEISWKPEKRGRYTITASFDGEKETISITFK